ncbi:MAG: hypothetical protein LAN84_04535 [Acidobacteriia bacterium]|nr:hypothetical protein [Terriglobia bacterium]
MDRFRSLLVLLAVSFVTAPAVAQSLDDLVAQSQLIFRGTIVKLGASTLHEVPLAGNMAIVRVDLILDAASAYADLAGHNVTVVLKNPKSARAGEKRTFFTASWLFGRSIGVREVGSFATGAMAPLSVPDVAASRRRIAEARLRARLGLAAQIIQGEVMAIRPQARANPPSSEHDPDWWLATIRVDEAIKGSKSDEVIVAFPNSTDVVWAIAPKFVVGQKGVWILRRADLLGVLAPEYLTALDPHDVQPMESAARIRALAK